MTTQELFEIVTKIVADPPPHSQILEHDVPVSLGVLLVGLPASSDRLQPVFVPVPPPTRSV